MRNILPLLIMTIVTAMSTTSDAEQLYLGRVIAVDRGAGRLSVAIIDDGDADKADAASENSVHVTIPAERLPGQLSPGSIVRIWGNLSAKTLTLEASRLILTGQAHGTKDPTGVRRRIGKSRGHYGGRGGGKGHGRR